MQFRHVKYVMLALCVAVVIPGVLVAQWWYPVGEDAPAMVAGMVETVENTPELLSLGFNNAEQVVEAGDGSYLVWASGNALTLAARDAAGSVTETTSLATGNIQLPAIARDGDAVVVGWVETTNGTQKIYARVSTNNAASFGDEVILGSGTGISLAASEGKIYAVWHEQGTKTAQIFMSTYEANAWSSPVRVDQSTASPVWASVESVGSRVYVVWRDDRKGSYSIWLRRSADGGATWEAEQHVLTASSGDPDICALPDGQVWIAHHGRGRIGLMHSLDYGETFSADQTIGNGYFAHLNCTTTAAAIAWEYTLGSAKDENKESGWAVYDASEQVVNGGRIADGSSAAATAFLMNDGQNVEVLWVKVTGNEPLTGLLRHQIFSVE
jgi:hypothetical protein